MKLKAKFFKPFQMLHWISKQTYKLELSKKWKINKNFYMLLLKQDTTRKERVDKNVTKLEAVGNRKMYKIEIIHDSVVYGNKVEGHLSGFYHLVA